MQLAKKLDRAAAMTYIQQNEAAVKQLYIIKDLTARLVAERLNIHFDSVWAKALNSHFGPKGKGKGGARLGSGNKRGTKFCTNCGKKLEKGHECTT